MITQEKLTQLVEQTQEIAKEVGAFIRKERQHFSVEKVEHKGFNDLVSYVDKEAERQIVDRLSLILPEAGFLQRKAPILPKEKSTIGSLTLWMGLLILSITSLYLR